MREFLFRGISKYDYKKFNIKKGDWVYGNLKKCEFDSIPDEYYISLFDGHGMDLGGWNDGEQTFEVIPETVEQYIGLKDKNDKKIFEGDIVKDTTISYGGYHDNRYKRSGIAVVKFGYHDVTAEGDLFYYGRAYGWYFDGDTVRETPAQYFGYDEHQNDKRYQFEVIGNIFDNPELIDNEET